MLVGCYVSSITPLPLATAAFYDNDESSPHSMRV